MAMAVWTDGPLAFTGKMKIPDLSVSGFIGPEKQTMRRGFSLKPSSLSSSCLFPQTAAEDERSQVFSEDGISIRRPVFWKGSVTVSELFGNGPPKVEFRLKATVVCAAHVNGHANTDKKASMWCENLGVNIVWGRT